MDTEKNEDWENEFREYFDKTLKPKKPTMKNLDRELCVNFIKNTIRSIRQSNKELILGKMVKKGYTQEQIEEYDETNSRDDAMEKGRMIGINQTLDTCKSIVEEVMR